MTFDAVKTRRDDVALLGFTSGTTGEPKATMHFHSDLLIIADGYAQEILGVTPRRACLSVRRRLPSHSDLADWRSFRCASAQPRRFWKTPRLPNMVEIIETYKATISFTAPTAYRAMLAAMHEGADLSSLRIAVSAGETLPAPVFKDWIANTGKANARRHWLDRNAAHIHFQPASTTRRRRSTGKPVDRL